MKSASYIIERRHPSIRVVGSSHQSIHDVLILKLKLQKWAL
jgi:hypothetical protein